MIAYFLGLISALSFGVGNAYWKKATGIISYPQMVIIRGILASACFGILWLCFGYYGFEGFGLIFNNARVRDYFFTAVVCLVCSLGLLFFLKSMAYQEVSITVALASINIFNILTAVIFLGEVFYKFYLVSFSFAGLGILLIQNFNFHEPLERWNKGTTYSLLAAFFWGITYPLFRIISPKIGALPLAFLLETSVTLMALIWAFVEKNNHGVGGKINAQMFKICTISSLLLIGGTLSFNLAIQNLSILTLDILSNIQLVIPVLIGFFWYQEKVNFRQLIGMGMILFSILLVQFFI